MITAADFFRSLLHHSPGDVFSLVFPAKEGAPEQRIGLIKEIEKGGDMVTDIVFAVLNLETGAVNNRGWHNDGESKVFPEVEFIGQLRDDPAWASLIQQVQNKNNLYDVLKSFGLRVPCSR